MNITAALLLAAMLVGPERPAAAPAYGPAYGTQYPHTLLTDGTDFLALWTGMDGVHAAAVDERGAVRPTPSRALFQGQYVQGTWTGDAYLLAWYFENRVLTARMNRDAQLISAPVPLAVGDAVPVAMATSGSHTLIVLSRYLDMTAILVGPDGQVVRGNIAIPAETRPYAVAAVAVDGGFLIATIETTYAPVAATTARAIRISAEGAVESSVKLIERLPHNVNSIDAAAKGDRAGIAFVARRNTPAGPQRLYTFTVDAHTLAATAHAPRMVVGDDPQVVPTPGGFAAGMIEYQTNAPLLLTTIPFDTGERHATELATSAPGSDLRMASNGQTVMSVWRDYRFSPPYSYSTTNMFGIAFDATATRTETGVLPVAISGVAQGHPAIASAGTTSLVAWMDLTRTVQGNVMVRRFDARGNPLDSAPTALVADVAVQQPVVAFTGEVWIVVWRVVLNENGNARSYMRRVARNGAVLDPQPVDLGPGAAIAAASNGTVTLLAFDRQLLRFSRAGERLETITLPETVWGGVLASNGSDFLLVWTEGSDWWQFPSPNYIDVHAIRLDASGHPVGARIDVATSPANELSPVVASNGTDFLIAYAHIAGEERVVRAKRVLREGALADHTALQPGSLVGRGEMSYSVAPREDGYAAVFVRGIDGRTAALDTVALDARGVPAEEPVTLGITNWYSWSPSTAIASTMVAYTRTDPALGDVERVFVRSLGGEPPRRRAMRR
ncbi:MAG TPA: hypothetical protein VF432_12110 [Thermoanaerobaculia bacterium]